jgi:septal ring-binding cell division protein DamX
VDYSTVGIIILVLDIIALLSAWASPAENSKKNAVVIADLDPAGGRADRVVLRRTAAQPAPAMTNGTVFRARPITS